MAQVVYKYEIEIADQFRLMLPVDAQPLSVAFQNDKPVLWIRHTAPSDIENGTLEWMHLIVVGTGQEFPDRLIQTQRPSLWGSATVWNLHAIDGYKFVGTLMTADHQLVLHVFQELQGTEA